MKPMVSTKAFNFGPKLFLNRLALTNTKFKLFLRLVRCVEFNLKRNEGCGERSTLIQKCFFSSFLILLKYCTGVAGIVVPEIQVCDLKSAAVLKFPYPPFHKSCRLKHNSIFWHTTKFLIIFEKLIESNKS